MKFTIKAMYTTHLTAEIEAANEEEAYEIAHNMDGGQFDSVDIGDWRVYDVTPTEE